MGSFVDRICYVLEFYDNKISKLLKELVILDNYARMLIIIVIIMHELYPNMLLFKFGLLVCGIIAPKTRASGTTWFTI